MLLSADSIPHDSGHRDQPGGWEPAPAGAPISGAALGATGERSRYRQRKWDARSVLLVVAINLGLGAMFVSLRPDVAKVLPEPTLATFDVVVPSAPTPPPPSQPQPDTAALQSPIAAPDPIVKLPTQAPVVQAVELPRPQLQAVAFAPKAAPAPAALPAPPAPPAPVTPPSFDAAQLDNPAPRYPYLAKRAREQGVVTLRVLVSAQGRAKTLGVEHSSGSSRLDEEALKTVRRWKFLPAQQAGKAVEAWVLVPVTFALG